MASTAILQHTSSSPPATPKDPRPIVSSPNPSFMNGQQTPGSRNSLPPPVSPHSTSNGTPSVNPLYALSAQAKEVHVVKVTEDSVQIETGPLSGSYLGNMGKSVLNAIQPNGGDAHVGPPPPSPPASVDQMVEDLDEELDTFQTLLPGPRQGEADSMQTTTTNTILTDAPTSEPPSSFLHEQTTYSTPPSSYTNRTSASREPLQRSSTEIKPTHPRPTVILNSPPQSASSSSARATAHMSVDGYLQPPVVSPNARPARRNTTGSTALSGKRSHAHGKGASQPFGTNDDSTLGEGGLEIQTDIEIHAEKIRRERMSKRAKAQQEAEAALTGDASTSKDAPLVGNLIGEDHVNYVLMYNMLTGIRIGVSRCQAKVKRPLTDEDFVARHKFSFDIIGNELTPSAKYDFKFKDYAPWVFRYLREDHFQLDPADYLLSLTAKYILSELGSPGKSGSFFYFSCDYRFIIKTIRHSEHKFLLSILPKYYEHVQANPHTLLSRFYGLHRVKLPRGRKIHFVIMNNLFPPHKDVHETYDLKGSTVGREYPEERAAQNPRAVMKDLNWIHRSNTLELGPEKRALLTEQLRRDAEFLKEIQVMDYSLLIGIHHMKRGNRENVRRNTLKVFSPNLPEPRRSKTSGVGAKSPEAVAMRRAMRSSDPKRLGKHTVWLPEEDTGDRQHFVFYQDEGGLRATDEANEGLNTIYYLGVIDILTPYTFAKKLEHCWKGMQADRHKISPVPPVEYADRFFSFMKAIMRGGEGGQRFLEKKDQQADKPKQGDPSKEKQD